MRSGWLYGLIGLGVLAEAAGCGSMDSKSDAAPASQNGADFGSGGSFSSGDNGGPNGGAAPGGGGAASLPPEKEVDVGFELPHAGANYVYVANPDSNTIAVIDSKHLSIQTVNAGAEPRFLQTFGAADAALVLNVSSSDATIVRTGTDGTSRTSTVSVQRGSNAIAVSPDGTHAVVYYDQNLATGSAAPGSPQDVTVVHLAEGGDTATDMTIGYQPSKVFFTKDGTRAFVVTQDGASILDFSAIDANGSGIARTVSLGSSSRTEVLDVSVTPDGRYALARESSGSELRLVDLLDDAHGIRRLDVASVVPPSLDAGTPPGPDAGAPPTGDSGTPTGSGDASAPPVDAGDDSASPVSTLSVPPRRTLSSASETLSVTDVDLAPDGTYALAVIRERALAVRVPIPGGFSAPSTVTSIAAPGELIGSVAITPKGKYALLYTTADPTNERLTIASLDGSNAVRTVQLRQSIASVAVSPDDHTALLIHEKQPGDPNEPGISDDQSTARKDGYSVVDLDIAFPKLELAPSAAGPTVIVPDGSNLFMLFDAPGVSEVHQVDLRSLQIWVTELGSPPVSVGALPGSSRVFVGQDHPAGRISFIDWGTREVQSVTGFELNSKIRE
ncbi:MAG TPA: hypothetical protein VHE30_14530 [Polyangiaceae bacterium]|nr:hypothetical protein [Polyangiaceae bacterium]